MNKTPFLDELEKLSYVAFTPFGPKDKKELDSGKGYLKEFGNRLVSSSVGAMAGYASGAAAGLGALLLARKGLKGRDLSIIMAKNAPQAAALAGGVVGAYTGAITSDIRSIRKTERGAGVKPMGAGKHLGRTLGSSLLGPLGDYGVSRHLQIYETQKSKK